jgi:hypothetical protein
MLGFTQCRTETSQYTKYPQDKAGAFWMVDGRPSEPSDLKAAVSAIAGVRRLPYGERPTGQYTGGKSDAEGLCALVRRKVWPDPAFGI